MFNTSNLPNQITIGREGENGYRSIDFDVTEWKRELPTGTISIVYARPDGTKYPVVSAAAGNTVTWAVSATDTQFDGFGSAELRLISGAVVAKSKQINIRVLSSITGDAPAPTPPAPDWITTAAALQAQIGDLEELETTNKDNLVEAVNEVKASGGGFDIHGLTTEDSIADGDETPFYDVSASNKRKTTWSNVKAKLKAYFDTLYIGASALSGYATQAWVEAKGYLTQHQSLAGYATEAWVTAKNYLTQHQSLADYSTTTQMNAAISAHHDATKQDTIADLATIRSGAALGATALQEHQSLAAYRTSAAQDTIDGGKLDKQTDGADTRLYSHEGATQGYMGIAGTINSSTRWLVPYVDAVLNYHDATKQSTALTATVTIAVADWNGGTTVTKNVTGVTASNVVFCDASDSSVQCTAQGSGTLTFTADATPTDAITVKVVILP